ncbi:MAG: 4'-phosphopantetheinyl transferase superfamily protein [Bacteroidales bacterium]|jgi:phosphopantetheinyl transferase|nr:4'-phosphopantetheinyl transferase superfamily protein [Bacteroidales bacterium]
MIKVHKKFFNNTTVAVWQITETEEIFCNSLHLLPKDKWRINNCKNRIVRLQKLACRATLAELLGTNKIEITYSATGQPQLKDYHISFSHTKTSVAVALAKCPVGIDIEEIAPRILPLYSRFMSEREILCCDVNNLQDLYYFWCSKEAMYKWYAKGNLDFIKDIYVNKTEKKGIVCQSTTVQLADFSIDNQIIVTCH